MAKPSKLLLLIALAAVPAFGELKPKQMESLDQFIKERSRAPQMTPGLVGEMAAGLNQRLEALETKILPIAIILGRAVNDLKRLEKELDTRITEIDGGKMNINPYEDAGWIKLIRKDMDRACCEMKAGIGIDRDGEISPSPAVPSPVRGGSRQTASEDEDGDEEPQENPPAPQVKSTPFPTSNSFEGHGRGRREGARQPGQGKRSRRNK